MPQFFPVDGIKGLTEVIKAKYCASKWTESMLQFSVQPFDHCGEVVKEDLGNDFL